MVVDIEFSRVRGGKEMHVNTNKITLFKSFRGKIGLSLELSTSNKENKKTKEAYKQAKPH